MIETDKKKLKEYMILMNEEYFSNEEYEICQMFPFKKTYVCCLRYKATKEPMEGGMIAVSPDLKSYVPFSPFGMVNEVGKAAKKGVTL